MTESPAGQDAPHAAANDDGPADWGALSDLPGNPLMWVLIISELLVFGAFFAGFAFARIGEVAMFDASQAKLDRLIGGINTMVLLSSGLLAALAVRARAEGLVGRSRLWLSGAGALGMVFCVVKVMEYADKAAQGIGIETNTFFTLFYLITGFHFLHVLFGLVILVVVGWKNSLENLETGVAFWHMVDLIWVIVYPLVYLIR